MSGSPLSIANFLMRKRQVDEMSAARKLQQQKMQEPSTTEQGRINASIKALGLMGPNLMATKKLLADQHADPHFRWKWFHALNVYKQGISGDDHWFPTIKQQLFFGIPEGDQTQHDMMRYFGLTGQLYATGAPTLTAGTGMRPGPQSLQMVAPHIPDYAMVPQQNWERLQNIYPRLKQEFAGYANDPLTGKWVSDQARVQIKAADWKSRFTPDELEELSPGVYGDTRGRLPASAMAIFKGGKVQYYRDLATGQQLPKEAGESLPLIKSPTFSAFPPSARGTLAIPSKLGGPGAD